jgi:hypothetical protein
MIVGSKSKGRTFMKFSQKSALVAACYCAITATSGSAATQTATQPASAPPAAVAPASPEVMNKTVPTGCTFEVLSAPSIAGVTKKSGLMKFALGTVLPSIAGSVAGSGGGGGSFEAGRQLTTQSSIATNRAMADKASDVPEVIANEYAPQLQKDAATALVAARPIKEGGPAQCLRRMEITGIIFEHSKDYKARNAIVIQSALSEYRAGIGKPFIRVFDETRTELKASPLADAAGKPALQLELKNAMNSAIGNLLDRFANKQK